MVKYLMQNTQRITQRNTQRKTSSSEQSFRMQQAKLATSGDDRDPIVFSLLYLSPNSDLILTQNIK